MSEAWPAAMGNNRAFIYATTADVSRVKLLADRTFRFDPAALQ